MAGLYLGLIICGRRYINGKSVQVLDTIGWTLLKHQFREGVLWIVMATIYIEICCPTCVTVTVLHFIHETVNSTQSNNYVQ